MKHYTSLAGWDEFARLGRDEFQSCAFKDQLIAECDGNEDIAWVLFHHMGDHALEWLHKVVPALEHNVPIELIRSGQADRVRACLWSFP